MHLNDFFSNDAIRNSIVSLIVSLSGVAITYITGLLKDFKLKTKYETLAEISDMVMCIVDQLYQEFIEDLKNDGKFTKEEQEKFRQLAVSAIMSALNKRHKKLLGKMFKDFGLDAIANLLLQRAIKKRKDGYNTLFEFNYKF